MSERDLVEIRIVDYVDVNNATFESNRGHRFSLDVFLRALETYHEGDDELPYEPRYEASYHPGHELRLGDSANEDYVGGMYWDLDDDEYQHAFFWHFAEDLEHAMNVVGVMDLSEL